MKTLCLSVRLSLRQGVYSVWKLPEKYCHEISFCWNLRKKLLSYFNRYLDQTVSSNQFTERSVRFVCFMLRALIRCVSFFLKTKKCTCRSHWPRCLRRSSAASRLLRLSVRIPPGAWMFVVSVVCCQLEISATGWSLSQRSPTDCDASLCVI